MEKLMEKVTCNKCSNVEYREIETLNNAEKGIDTLRNKLTAVIVKKFECSNCDTSDFQSDFVNVKNESIA